MENFIFRTFVDFFFFVIILFYSDSYFTKIINTYLCINRYLRVLTAYVRVNFPLKKNPFLVFIVPGNSANRLDLIIIFSVIINFLKLNGAVL
jgi:hypothetical protein